MMRVRLLLFGCFQKFCSIGGWGLGTGKKGLSVLLRKVSFLGGGLLLKKSRVELI